MSDEQDTTIQHGHRARDLTEFVAVLEQILLRERPVGTISNGTFRKGFLFVTLAGVECHLSGDSTVAGVEAFLRAVRLFNIEIRVIANKAGVINKIAIGAEDAPISGFYLYTSKPLEEEQALVVPTESVQHPHASWASPDLSIAPTSALLALYGSVVAELMSRGVLKTKNLVGEYGEWLVNQALGGELAPASTKAYDLTCSSYGTVQVKCRQVSTPMTASDKESGAFSNADFDHVVFVLLSKDDLSIVAGVLYSSAQLQAIWSPKAKGHFLRMTPANLAAGLDITADLQRAALALP